MLDELGLVRAGASFAHGVFLDDDDMRLLAARGASVVTNPSSNLRLHNGVAPVREMVEAGLAVGLGSDSGSLDGDDDLWSELRLMRALHRRRDVRDRGLDAASTWRIASSGVAGAARDRGGSLLAPGDRADLILVDLRLLGPLADGVDPLEAVVGLASRHAVAYVVVGGQLLKEPSLPRPPPPVPMPVDRSRRERALSIAEAATEFFASELGDGERGTPRRRGGSY
jgi:cytosine/adenosine deaminase-related metal-dependent hydrolase